MSSKQSTTAPASKDTPESVLGTFTEETIKAVGDQGIRELLLQLHALLVGMLTALLTAKDPEQKVVAGHLAEVNITVEDAKQLIADAETLLELLKDRDNKESAAQSATTKLDIARGQVNKDVHSYIGIIRSELGPRSPALDGFGIKKLGGGRPGARKNKQNGAGDASKPAPNGSETAAKS